ncbi:MAG: lysophospholipase [Bacteroidetes bacterium]|nr:lysophospholipase [Bacteroidota bacterium]
MQKNPTALLSIFALVALLYVLFCLLLYFKQERLIFFPTPLPDKHNFYFQEAFEELTINTPEGIALHGLLFKTAKNPEGQPGLVFFLHGNAGSLDSWGTLAPFYTRLGYDVFMLDYRGYGKSGGRIESEAQFYADVQAAYQRVAGLYPEENIVIMGVSIGTGAAAMLASRNQVRMLLLLTPYYSLTDMVCRTFPLVPPFLLKYKFRTHTFLDSTTAPVYLFHDTEDEVIPYASAQKLLKYLKPGDQFYTLQGTGHNSIHESQQYQEIIRTLLAPAGN